MDVVGGPIRTVMHVVGRFTTVSWREGYQDILYEVILTGAIIIIVFIMQKREKLKWEIKKLSWVYYVIGVFVCFIVGLLQTFVCTFGEGQGAIIENFAEILCTCFSEGVYFLAIALVVINEFRKRYQEESLLKSENMEMLKEYHRSQEHHVREVRKIQHDIRNHLLMIEKYLEQGKINETKEYLNQVAGEFTQKREKIIDVGNDAASALLSMEKEKAGEGINFHCEGNLKAESVVSDYDLCVILSNLLSNAREACERLRQKKKKVTVLLKEEQGEVAIIIKNPIEWDVDVEKLGTYTTKEEKQKHGYGLSNVMETVERYNGEIKFRVKDGEFSVNIRI
jgi:sensor histidine kinase YesM